MALSPPECVREMKCLQRSKFSKTVCVPAIRVNGKHCSVLLKKLSKCLLNLPRLRNIVPDTKGDLKKKLVLLNSKVKLDAQQESLLKSCEAEEMVYQLTLDYNYWSGEQILRAVLPVDIAEVTTAFETIGHIAHMNLRDSQLDYKTLIGTDIIINNVGHSI